MLGRPRFRWLRQGLLPILARRVVLDWRCMPVVYAYEKPSDLRQSIHPQGFYDVRRHVIPWLIFS
jgi:hypothetical protein